MNTSSLLAWMLASLCVSFVTTTEVLDKRSLSELLDLKCPLQCSGQISNIALERMCRCIWRPGTFMYGKRGDASHSAASTPTAADDNEDLLRHLLMSKEAEAGITQNNKPTHGNTDILKLLLQSNFEEDRKKPKPLRGGTYMHEPLRDNDGLVPTQSVSRKNLFDHETQQMEENHNDDNIPGSRADIGQAIKELLAEKSGIGTTDSPGTLDGAKLFQAEFGKDINSATSDDFLKWVEKEMEIAEARLFKLLEFYKFIKATSSM